MDEPIASAAHAAVFLQQLLPCWFALRREWPRAPHRAVPYIRGRDPVFYATLSEMVEGGTARLRAAACRRAYERILPRVETTPEWGCG